MQPLPQQPMHQQPMTARSQSLTGAGPANDFNVPPQQPNFMN